MDWDQQTQHLFNFDGVRKIGRSLQSHHPLFDTAARSSSLYLLFTFLERRLSNRHFHYFALFESSFCVAERVDSLSFRDLAFKEGLASSIGGVAEIVLRLPAVGLGDGIFLIINLIHPSKKRIITAVHTPLLLPSINYYKQRYTNKHMFCALNMQKQNHKEENGILSSTTTETDQIGETVTAMENQACFNLCELSDHICESSIEMKERAMFPERYRFSPWKLKEGKKKIHFDQERKMNERAGVSQRDQPIYRPKQRYSKHENKENLLTAKSYTRPYDELSKYPDIVNRLYTLKQGKMTGKPKINKEDPSIELITCMKKKPNLKRIMCHNKIMVEQEDGQILPYSRQISLAKYDKGSHREATNNQNSNSQENIPNQKQQKDQREDTHIWRIRSRSKNGEKNRIPEMLVSKEMFREREGCTETINVGKCSINLIEKSKEENYSSNNPLSRLLYYKYLHTISVDHAPKDGRKKFL